MKSSPRHSPTSYQAVSKLVDMRTAKRHTGSYRPTADRCLAVILSFECLLWLSEEFQWFPFNEYKGLTVLIAAGIGVATIASLPVSVLLCLLLRVRLQFGIRSLLILTVVVAIPSSWLGVQMREAGRQRDAVATIQRLNGDVTYRGFRVPYWLPSLFGDDFFYEATDITLSDCRNVDAALATLNGLKHVHELSLLAPT